MNLSKLLEKCYIENSRYEIVPPAKTIKELETGRLVISDYEIGDEEIPIIVRFLRTKQALKYITSIEVNKTSGSKVNRRRTNSALNSNGAKFFRELIHFFQSCKALESLTFESVEMSSIMAGSMCRALADNCTGLRWLMFKNCDIESDYGLKAMAPYLGRMQLQVLGVECCNLTDTSFPYICSFLKAQECNSDALYWNATLRTDPFMDDKRRIREETGFVYSRGLVALSLFGNRLCGENMDDFNEIMRKNYWLLGLNLAENKLEEESLNEFVKEMKQNQVIQAVLLRNNPGLTSENCLKLYKSVFAKMQVTDDLGNNGFARLNLLGPTVSWMVKSWMRLQCEETRDLISASSPTGPRPDSSMNFDKTQMSLSTLGTASGAMVSRSPRRQREIEQKILYEEAKEYSVVAYTEPKTFHFTKSDSVRASSTHEQSMLNSHGNEEGGDFESVPNRLNGEDDGVWETSVPIPSPPMDGKKKDSKKKSSSDKKSKHPQDESAGEGEFFGYWPDEYIPRHANLERPPSRISIRPRTALAATSFTQLDDRNNMSAISVSSRTRMASPVMTGRHSQDMQEEYDIKDVDLVSNQRYIPRYLKARGSKYDGDDNLDGDQTDRPLRTSSLDASNMRGSVSRSQQLSRAKSPPWRPPSAHHQDPHQVPRVPLAQNVAVFHHRGSVTPSRSRMYRDDVRDKNVFHYQPTRSSQDDNNRRSTTPLKGKKKKTIKKTVNKDGVSKKESKRKTTNAMNSQDVATYRAVSDSVVKATKRLEQASAKLLSVAESLSESAIAGANQSHLSGTSGTRTQHRARTPTTEQNHVDSSYLSNGSGDDTALEELVRARLNFNLRKTLNEALHGTN